MDHHHAHLDLSFRMRPTVRNVNLNLAELACLIPPGVAAH
jgi:hypothetical protein